MPLPPRPALLQQAASAVTLEIPRGRGIARGRGTARSRGTSTARLARKWAKVDTTPIKQKLRQPTIEDLSELSSPATTTTNPVVPLTYLSTRLIVPYFINFNGEIKRPEHLIAWWTRIFSFYVPDEKDHIVLRSLCRLFRDSLKPPPLWTMFFPHQIISTQELTLLGFLNMLNKAYNENPMKAPMLVFIGKGTFAPRIWNDVDFHYPIKIIGAGQNKTFLTGYNFRIGGKKEKEKTLVVLKDMTIMRSSGTGLYASNGLSFLCERMTFTQCRFHGVHVKNTKGRLINCVITQCGFSGIACYENALIELEGSQTKVDGNSKGLETFDTSSRIHLLFPLTKESVSTTNSSGRDKRWTVDMNWCCRVMNGQDIGQTIQTVNVFNGFTATRTLLPPPGPPPSAAVSVPVAVAVAAAPQFSQQHGWPRIPERKITADNITLDDL
jgi:hypothetical protein